MKEEAGFIALTNHN